MVPQQQQIITLSTLLLVATTSAFSAAPTRALQRSFPSSPCTSSSTLNVGGVWMDDNEKSYAFNRASDCANSESCGLEEAQSCLDELTTQITTMNWASETAFAVSEVVVNLQQKIESDADAGVESKQQQQQQTTIAPSSLQSTMSVMYVVAGLYVVCAIFSDVAGATGSIVPFDDSALASFDAYTIF